MTDALQKRYAPLLARLSARANPYPSAVRRLGDALWNTTDDPQAHAECLERLPEVIDAELAGESIVQRFPTIKHHLDCCDTCAQEYAELLDSEWAEQHSVLSTAQSASPPNLGFLPPPRRSLQEVVLEWTRGILAQLEPQTVSMSDALAKAVFTQLKPRQASEARAPYFFSQESDVTDGARRTLAASYVSTQELVENVTRTQFDAWVSKQQLTSELESRALGAARSLGLEDKVVLRFARAYAAQVSLDASALREFLR